MFSHNAAHPVLTLRLFGWGLIVAVVLLNVDLSAKRSVLRPAVADSAAALVDAHGCGDDVVDPTHAVVTVDQETRYVGQRLTDLAIEQAVFGIDHGLVVHGFCS